MLILKQATMETEGQWFDFIVRGETISIKIRPLTSEIVNTISKKHTKTINKFNQSTGTNEKKNIVDADNIGRDIIDYVVEDFSGVGTGPNEPLEINKENKLTLLEIPTLDNEIDLQRAVMDKAKELAAISEKDYEEMEKN